MEFWEEFFRYYPDWAAVAMTVSDYFWCEN
jgi:hypothetical protein